MKQKIRYIVSKIVKIVIWILLKLKFFLLIDRLARIKNECYLSLVIKKVGKNASIGHGLIIVGGENIIIGDDFNSIGNLFLYGNEGEVKIGNHCSFNNNVLIGAAQGRVIIGNYVLIGPNVVLRAADHGMNYETEMRYQKHTYGEIVLEDDCWIGANVVITRNVKIGKGSVIAAGAVVTKNTEEYSINAGVPAKKIGTRKNE